MWKYLCVGGTLLMAAAITSGGAAESSLPQTWEKTLERAAFEKEGKERLHHPHYQYEILGLGGTTLRVSPHGFTAPPAHWSPIDVGHLRHHPFLAYQYWWSEEGHRLTPFSLLGGYGEESDSGVIESFRHHLDVRTGLLTIDLDLKIAPVEVAGQKIPTRAVHSRRDIFVTPGGVVVARVTDSAEASLPFGLRVFVRSHEGWSPGGEERDGELVVEGRREQSCVATLAVAITAPSPRVSVAKCLAGAAEPGGTITFFLAPGSSYEGPNPIETALAKARRAKERGFDSVFAETKQWWMDFYARSAVGLPDRDLAVWYARSLYYHGVFFGNTDIPPGCWGTNPVGFNGAICPEYDLVFNDLALLYTNHLAESRRIVDWIEKALPRAERYAAEGLTLHKTHVKYASGAKFGPLMGYDGTILSPPTESEGAAWAYSNHPGANAGLIALSYLDWTCDKRYEEIAKRILKETTEVSMQDLEWRPDFQAYLSRWAPSAVQQSAAIYGLRESVRRGVAKPGWKDMLPKVYLPTADLDGRRVITVGPGAPVVKGSGDATWLIGLWWYGNLDRADPLLRATYQMLRSSQTGSYVFNRGWLGVYAAKLGEAEEAYRWARSFLQPNVCLFDDTCFGEIVWDWENFKKTPEIAAHGSLMCNIVQMLLDPDDEDTITVFPAIPDVWERSGVAFSGLAAQGGIKVSAEFTRNAVRVTLENSSAAAKTRQLRVRLPRGVRALSATPTSARVETGWAVISDIVLQPGQSSDYRFAPDWKAGAP